jgi:DNA-binding transcriptional LysR family regulator
LTRGNDHFPVPLNKRKIGYETATADAAIPILLTTDQIAYLPDILVRPLVDKGELREVRSGDLPPVERELYLSAKSDSVPAAVYNRLLSEMSEKLIG